MKLCIYYVTPDGSKSMRGYVYGETENECFEKAYKQFGKENVYGYCRV